MMSVHHVPEEDDMEMKLPSSTTSSTVLLTTNAYKTSFGKHGLCRRGTTLGKIFMLLLGVALMTAAAAVPVDVDADKSESDTGSRANIRRTIRDVSTNNDEQEVCTTTDCVLTAAEIIHRLDTTTNPCDDFYQFACGGWLQSTVLPADKSSVSSLSQISDRVTIITKHILEGERKDGDLPSLEKARAMYASCYNTDLINSRGDSAFKTFLTDRLGGWPLTTGDWTEAHFDFAKTLIEMENLQVAGVISNYVSTDIMNSQRRILYIDQPSFGMPGMKYYNVPRNDTLLMAYENLIYGVGEIMGFVNPDTAQQEVADIVDFEIRLVNISVPSEQRRNYAKRYNKMTLAEVQGNYSALLNWRQYYQSLLGQPQVGITDVTDDEIIINGSPSYFQKVEQVLKETSTKTLANYLVWRVIQQYLNTQSDAYVELNRKYRKALYGVSRETERYIKCSWDTVIALPYPIGRSFMRDHFDISSKTAALEMITNLQASFNEILDEVDWMEPETKAVAKEKNAAMSPKIGYPEKILNDSYVEELYKDLTFNPDTYFENKVAYNEYSAFKDMRELREPIDKTTWDAPPTMVNAFYSSTKNMIAFPAGILQPNVFSRVYPKSLNYGGIGWVIGHEMTHGFDDRGRQFDKDGNLAQWWNETDVARFKAKAQCFIDHYGNFTVEEIGLNINGINTQGENIADNGGNREAFRAYRKWVQEQGKEEQPLPGMNYTHNQLFFIAGAQVWCSKETDGLLRMRILSGVHTPPKYRVTGLVQNSEDFAQAFNCPPNSYMNPVNKCRVW